MRSKSGVWTFLAAAALSAVVACAGSTPSSPASAHAPGPAPIPAFTSSSDARAQLLRAEDRRAFDPALLAAASKVQDPAVRAHAALAAGRIGDDRSRDMVRGMLSDGSPEVRSAAAFACQLLEDGTATPDLISLLADSDPRVAASAARAIGTIGRGDGQDALIAAIPKAAAPEPRAAMLQSLWRYSDGRIVEAALPYAADPDPKVRSAALFALSRKPIEASLSALTAALSDSDGDNAAGAARGLGILGRKESLAPLAVALDNGKPHLVTSTLSALEQVLEKNPGSELPADRRARVIALAGDSNPNIAIPALTLLRQLVGSDREALQRVWSIAMTGQGRRRQVALLSAVAALRDRAHAAIDAAMAAPEAPLRAAAAESLSYLPDAQAAPYRARLTADPEALVRISVLTSLRSAESVNENRALVDSALSDPDAGVRASAIDALALLNDPAVLPQLQQTVEKSAGDQAPDVAIAAIGLAEKLRTAPEARAVVEAAYRLPKTLTERLARRSLVRYFRADAAAYPAPEYKVSRTLADYTAILADAARPWKAEIETVRGTFALRFSGQAAPMTVMNFIDLARKGFFDGIAIHRVVPDFVVQDGDPTGTGNGGPGYEIRDENDQIPYGTGTVGMALAGRDTGGSQWFVTQSPQPHLDGLYTVFAQVAAGQDVVERIEQWDRITRVTVSEAP